MEELSGILLELLQKHYRVSLPGIGSFVVTDQSARVDEQTNTILPPTKKVIFSKQETWNDGLLEAMYAVRFDISESEAQERIRHLMMDIRFDLDDKGKVVFPNLGCLRQGKQNTIDLEQKVNLAEVLGLTPVPFDLNPSRRNPQSFPDDLSHASNRGYKDYNLLKALSSFKLKPQKIVLMVVAGLIGIAVSAGLIVMFLGRSNQNEQELLPPKKQPSTHYYELPSLDEDSDDEEELYEQPVDPQYDSPNAAQKQKKTKNQSPTPKPTQKEPPSIPRPARNVQYCVIITSVTSRIAADREVSTLKGAGYRNCHIAEVKNGRYRVALGCYSDQAQARRELAIAKRTVSDAWLLEKHY
jgi:nucleoid DNA-binding protein